MANIQLSPQDIDYIARVVATEVPANVRRNPLEYQRMIGAVVDTVMNRTATGRYGASVTDVLNQPRAFSKITGPKRLDPYGSVENTPAAPKAVKTAVDDYLAKRAGGKKAEIGGATDYANPKYSDRSNLRGWINPMIRSGAVKLGIGNAIHYHGNAPGSLPAPKVNVSLPAGFMPPIERNMRYQDGVPIPSIRPPMAIMASGKTAERGPQPIQARAFAQGGILGPSSISFNPVGSANAGEMQRRPAVMPPMTRPQAAISSPILTPDRPMPSGPIPAPKTAPVIDPAKIAANYAYYGQTRASAPVAPISAPPVAGPEPIQQSGIPAIPQTFGQKIEAGVKKAFTPQNIKSVALPAIGSAIGGPVGGLIGTLLSKGADGNQGMAGQGLLAGLLSGGSQKPIQSNYIGNGMNAVNMAMYGNRRGDTATYNSQGGGSITNLGNGQYKRTSDKYGFTEIVNADGSRSTISTKKK